MHLNNAKTVFADSPNRLQYIEHFDYEYLPLAFSLVYKYDKALSMTREMNLSTCRKLMPVVVRMRESEYTFPRMYRSDFSRGKREEARGTYTTLSFLRPRARASVSLLDSHQFLPSKLLCRRAPQVDFRRRLSIG